MISAAIYQHLNSLPDLTAIVGTRLYNGNFEQDVDLPAVLFSTISEDYDHTLGEPAHTIRARVQVDCVADELSLCHTMADLIRSSLDAHSGDLQGVLVQFAKVDGSREVNQPPDDASDVWVYRVSTDYIIRYSAA